MLRPKGDSVSFSSSIRISFTRITDIAAAPAVADPPHRLSTWRSASTGSKFSGSKRSAVDAAVEGVVERDDPGVRLEREHEAVHDEAEADVLLRVGPAHGAAEACVPERVVRPHLVPAARAHVAERDAEVRAPERVLLVDDHGGVAVDRLLRDEADAVQ